MQTEEKLSSDDYCHCDIDLQSINVVIYNILGDPGKHLSNKIFANKNLTLKSINNVSTNKFYINEESHITILKNYNYNDHCSVT